MKKTIYSTFMWSIWKTSHLLLLLLLICGCEETETTSLFPEDQDSRIQANIKELQDLLVASEYGWDVNYRPAEETGSYRFNFQFKESGIVTMQANYDRAIFGSGSNEASESEYRILQGTTTKLSFSTASLLHRLADSRFSPIPNERGSGLKGDFEFLYYGKKSGDSDELIFRTNRTQDTVFFKKATQESIADIAASVVTLENFLEQLPRTSVYLSVRYTNSEGESSTSKFDYIESRRQLAITPIIEQGGEKMPGSEYNVGIDFTKEGIILDSLKIGNDDFTPKVKLAYDSNSDSFGTMLEGGGTIKLLTDLVPHFPTDGQRTMLDPNETTYLIFLYLENGIGGLTTPAFNELWEKLANRFTTFLPDFALIVQPPIIPQFSQFLAYQDAGDRLVITRVGNYSYPTLGEYVEFMDFLTDSEGFYVENLGPVGRFPNDVYTLTSAKNPAIRIGFYRV